MKLKLKPDAQNIPVDHYGQPCPEAYAMDTKTTNEQANKTLAVEFAIWRNKAEAEANKPPLKTGAYVWFKDAIPSIYSEEIPEVLDAENNVITPKVDKVLLVPKYGAYDTLFVNIGIDDQGRTTFGEVGESWVMLNVDPFGNTWGKNWEFDNN
jgi:hypothetical protein